MAKVRMSWDWVGDYPVFVYSSFIDHFKFNVKIIIGKKHDQNARGFGPGASAIDEELEYVQLEVASKREVVEIALQRAAKYLNVKAIKEHDITYDESHRELVDELPPWEEEENSHDSNKL